MVPSAQDDLEPRTERRSSMSLKFAALGSLTVLGALGTSARVDDRPQNLEAVVPHEPILITFGRKSSAAESTRPEAGVINRREATPLTFQPRAVPSRRLIRASGVNPSLIAVPITCRVRLFGSTRLCTDSLSLVAN